MAFTGGPKKVQGKGTAYPVGSPKHQDGTPEPVFYEAGPVNVPKPMGQVTLKATFTDPQIVGLVQRTLRMDPRYEALVELVEDTEPANVTVCEGEPGETVILVDYDL